MRSLILLVAFCAAFAASAQPARREANPATGDDARFARHIERLFDQFWKQNPEWAFAVGYYKYSDRLEVPDAASRAARLKLDANELAALKGFDERKLSPGSRVDLVLLRNQLESDIWYVKIFRDWQWQPSQYNVGDSFARQLDTEYAPLEKRLRDMLARLGKVPAYYAAARKNIDRPTLEHTDLALDQNKGALGVFGDDLLKTVDGSKLTNAEKALFKARVAAARAAIQGYVDFLTDLAAKLKQGGARSFRIGKELYAQKFAFDIQSGYTAEQLYEKALAEKASLLDRMEATARDLWPKYLGDKPMPADRLDLIGAVIGELSRHHTTPDRFVETIRNQLPELERFVREHDLVDLDASRPLIVRETPLYLRGVAGAGVDAPGPYDPTANTYYNVTPLDGYTPERAESYLREYNDWMLQLLNIHEAIPGHYVQLLHANKSKSLVKTHFRQRRDDRGLGRLRRAHDDGRRLRRRHAGDVADLDEVEPARRRQHDHRLPDPDRRPDEGADGHVPDARGVPVRGRGDRQVAPRDAFAGAAGELFLRLLGDHRAARRGEGAARREVQPA